MWVVGSHQYSGLRHVTAQLKRLGSQYAAVGSVSGPSVPTLFVFTNSLNHKEPKPVSSRIKRSAVPVTAVTPGFSRGGSYGTKAAYEALIIFSKSSSVICLVP